MSESDRTLLKAQVATLAGVKIVASAITLYYIPSWHALLIIILLSVPWVIAGGWYLYRSGQIGYRLWQVRKLRQRLIYEEWHVEDAPEEPISLPTSDGDSRRA